MLGEYVAIMTMCSLTTILFLGGWLPPFPIAPFTWVPGVFWFALKVCLVFFMFAMVKAFVPRYRYDQLMRLGWKVFLPLSLACVVIVAAGAADHRLGPRTLMAGQAGLIGALIGFVVGLIEYRLVTGIVVASLRRTDSSQTQAEKDDYERRIRLLKAAVLVVSVGGLPIVGYLVGRALFG
jgi:hypothetical protein